MKRITVLFLVIILCFGAVGCSSADKGNPWDSATYTENTEVGDGAKTLFVEVVVEDRSVLFTIHTDAETVGEALTENELISGEQGAYGLYVKKVNGIVADYDKNQCYWAFNKNGESMMQGVDSTEFTDGDKFELVYTK